MSFIIISNGEWSGASVALCGHVRTQKPAAFPPAPYECRQSYMLRRMTTAHKKNPTKNELQLLLVVVIVGQTPASATDRPAGPWEDFHAAPGGTVNYPTRYSNICFCASAEQTRQFKTYQGITKQQLNMTLIFPPSHTRGAKLHCARIPPKRGHVGI